MSIHIQTVCGHAIEPWLEALAGLRIQVFRDWPYLYDGTLEYEHTYLQRYTDSAQGLMVLALEDDVLVGASSGLPLRDADPEFRKPFARSLPLPEEIFYFGESVLDVSYRGQGLGHRFFDQREAFAREQGFAMATFCAVQRPADHPARPAQARALEPFWLGRGYAPLSGKLCAFHWRDIGQTQDSMKPMQFWGKWL